VAVGANNKASLTTAGLAPGSHSLTAIFSGDANFTGSAGSASESVSPDVTKEFSIKVSKPQRHGNSFRVRVTLTYLGGIDLPGPVFLAVEGLPGGVKLHGSSKSKRAQTLLGNPVIQLNLSGASAVSPGLMLSADLDFSSSSAGKIQFTPRLLAGVM
jgi:hypothetical protein